MHYKQHPQRVEIILQLTLVVMTMKTIKVTAAAAERQSNTKPVQIFNTYLSHKTYLISCYCSTRQYECKYNDLSHSSYKFLMFISICCTCTHYNRLNIYCVVYRKLQNVCNHITRANFKHNVYVKNLINAVINRKNYVIKHVMAR